MFSIICSVNGRRVPGEVTDNESTRPRDSLYEVNVKASLNKTLIDVPADIRCVLDIPQTDYVREISHSYNGEWGPLSVVASCTFSEFFSLP